MRKRLGSVLGVGVMALAVGVAVAPAASAKGRPCGPPVETSGTGTLGSPWTLKSMYDDNTAGQVVVGEEFEINTQVVGQVWTVTFRDNGTAFLTTDQTSTAQGIRVVQPNLYHGGTSHMAAHAVNHSTGEVVDGAVDLPVAPAACGQVVP